MAEKTEIRRFGYYIPKPDGTMDISVHCTVVDSDVLAEMNEIVGVIFNLQPIVMAFDVVEKNYKELVNLIDESTSHLNSLTSSILAPVSVVMDVMTSLSQKTTNFLSSTSAFLAHVDRQLEKIHGRDSTEWLTWDAKRKDLHAGSFAYRFLYELRNFAQHRDIPFSTLNCTGERNSEDASLVFQIKTLIVTEQLISSGHNWKKLTAQIEQQPNVFDLLPLASEYLQCLRQLCLEASRPQMERLAICDHYFNVLRNTLKIPPGAVPVIFVGESASKGKPPSRHEVIPMEQFSHLLGKLAEFVMRSQVQTCPGKHGV
ncbi:hypothetical protein [Geomesophilobacter sediminis]|uniref:Uncharacterized protein n=1 Tax=Geomesophilobacter sediminis TaxID=2798584 RepID=A0A8J7M3M7_9BACT|nr:hypothetical protein [Geomesophilobacter sediminis]MBJ6728022.1 hypothetical protein [Geomesophilobacter sediminis]